MSVKSIALAVQAGLAALVTATEGVLSALPINSGTSSAIKAEIDKVSAVAENLAALVENMGEEPAPVVNISETDLETAVSAKVSDYLSSALPSLVSSAVSAYFAANPPAAPTPEPEQPSAPDAGETTGA